MLKTFGILYILLVLGCCNAQTVPNEVDSTVIACGTSHDCAISFIPGIEFGGKAMCWGIDYHTQDIVPDEVCHTVLNGC